MRNLGRYVCLALLALLITPAVAKAHDFQFNDGLFFNANTNLYRQKNAQRPWQLTALPDTARIKQSVSFNGRIWLVVEINSKQSLYRQNRPLNFTAVDNFAEQEEIVLKPTGDSLVAFRQNGSQVGLTIFRAPNLSEPVIPPLVSSKNDLARIAEFDDKLLYLQQSGATVSVFRQKPPGWELTAQVNCDGSRLIEEPILGLYCRDGTVLRAETIERWVELNLLPVREIYSSEEILAGWDKVNNNLFHIWRSSSATPPIVLPLSFAEVSQVIISGSRIFFKKIDSNWRELDWLPVAPKLIELTDTSTGVIVPIVKSNGLFINGSKPQISTTVGEWRIIITVGVFNNAAVTPKGYFLWQVSGNSGSLAQYAEPPNTTFIKVPVSNPWSSTTSPIQAIEIGETTSFVSVINSSGNVNLYKTTNFTHWNRITLPTKPTFSPTISQARELDAGSLVELSGVITVGPKVVDDEVIYLEDATAGIQLYLGKTSGLLPSQINIQATVNGEISSSQTKRILLDTPADLELGSPTVWTQPTISPDQVAEYQGRSVQLKGGVTAIETDYLTLGQSAGAVKLHFADAKNLFQKDDQIQIPAVIDWNASSAKVESWATSTNYQILSRLSAGAPSQTSAAQTVSTTNKTTTVSKKLANANPPVGLTANQPKPAETPVIVANTQSDEGHDDSQTVSIGLVSLITGLLSFRGRRFRRYLPDQF